MVEGGFRGGDWGRIEKGPEGLHRLRTLLDTLLRNGGVEELEKLLEQEPQRDRNNRLRYLLTSGLAVELITGFARKHHDLDLVIMDPENDHQIEFYGTDNVTPGQYWADMRFEPVFLEDTAVAVRTRGQKGLAVEAVHPAVIMVQKFSDAFGRPPREKDQADVQAIVEHWRAKEHSSKTWNPIIETSVNALPSNQQKMTLARLTKALTK